MNPIVHTCGPIKIVIWLSAVTDRGKFVKPVKEHDMSWPQLDDFIQKARQHVKVSRARLRHVNASIGSIVTERVAVQGRKIVGRLAILHRRTTHENNRFCVGGKKATRAVLVQYLTDVAEARVPM